MQNLSLKLNGSLFIDSSNLEEIKKWNATGIIDGVTMNQSVMLKDGFDIKNFNKAIKSICNEMKNKPVSVELSNSTLPIKTLVNEAIHYADLSPNIVVKVPLIPETTKSLEVITELIRLNIPVNITALMTFEQLVISILSARKSSKVSFVSFFWGRSIEDHARYRSRFDFMSDHPRFGIDTEVDEKPENTVKATVNFLEKGEIKNIKLIVGSIRTATMVGEAFAAGSHIVTITPDILVAMLYSKRTIETIEQFDSAWIALLQNKKND